MSQVFDSFILNRKACEKVKLSFILCINKDHGPSMTIIDLMNLSVTEYRFLIKVAHIVGILLAECRVKIRQITTDSVNISIDSVRNFLQERLGLRKLATR